MMSLSLPAAKVAPAAVTNSPYYFEPRRFKALESFPRMGAICPRCEASDFTAPGASVPGQNEGLPNENE